MTLEEQWKNDVNQFGELAYLMWDMTEDSKDYYETPYSTGLWLENNCDCWLRICGREVYRKQSAALPFDLVAARAGDEVEVRDMTGWHNCICDFSTATIRKNLVSFDGKLYSAIALTNLRMKHPRRIGVDYSQFED